MTPRQLTMKENEPAAVINLPTMPSSTFIGKNSALIIQNGTVITFFNK